MGEKEESLSREWFAVRTRTSYEKVVFNALAVKEFESFLPLHRERRKWSDRLKELSIPIFPGYLFCRLNLQERLNILNTPGVMSLVGTSRRPVAIADIEIENLKRFIATEIEPKPHPFLYVGQKVRIERGPLEGVEGILEGFKTGYRLIVSVTLLQRSIAAELDASWIDPIPQSKSLRVMNVRYLPS